MLRYLEHTAGRNGATRNHVSRIFAAEQVARGRTAQQKGMTMMLMIADILLVIAIVAIFVCALELAHFLATKERN